jgi:erythronate-4-phosphate dehydrogenase
LERLFGGGTVGVIGLGNVGGRLAARLQRLGIRCIGYDPLLGDDVNLSLCELEQVLSADVVCCHTPLTTSDPFPTFHQLSAANLHYLQDGAVLLNAGRGGVIDEVALATVLAQRSDLRVVLDVWEGEPQVERALLQHIALATPHIAGYSLDGKLAGTRQLLAACCHYFAWPQPTTESVAAETAPSIIIDDELSGVALLRTAIQAVYDVRADDRRLRSQLSNVPVEQIGANFDALRKNYPSRREFAAVPIANWQSLHTANRGLLLALGFKPPR